MELVKDTEMEAAWQVWQARPPQPSLTVVVKATYALVADGVAELSDTQLLPTGDTHHDDDPERSLAYPSDLDPLKPHGECMVIGSVRVAGEVTFESTRVGVRVGSVDKQLAVFGDRTWRRGGPTPPVGVTEVPLTWERAFGGPGHAANPVGCGMKPASGEDRLRLPNLEDPKRTIAGGEAKPPSVGLGPIPRSWEPRLRYAGTYDSAWLTTRYPWYPEDLDWRFFCAAPADQQIEGFWRGDESIVLNNLHPVHPVVRCRLPGLAAHAYLVAEDDALRDVGLRLDTITIDADLGVAVCVWRGVVEVPHEDLSDFPALFVTHAAVGEAIDAPAAYAAKRAADAALEAALLPVSPPASDTAADGSTDAEAPAALDMNDPGRRWAHLDQAMTLRGEDDAVQKIVRDALAEQARAQGLRPVFDDALGFVRELSADRELTPEDLLELEMMYALGDLLEPEVDERREEVRDAVARGESLAGVDLSGIDLSGVGLVGADLRGAILTRANLSGAHFERCRFDGANLTEAEASFASFDACELSEAELYSLRAHRVRFHACRLLRAMATVSYLREARFMSCDLTQIELGRSDLTEADFRDCDLTEADLSSSQLGRSVFSRTKLVGAWLEGGIEAPGAIFDGCEATGMRASEGANLEGASFKRTRLDGARFGQSTLTAAVFNLATLVRADFSEATLRDAKLVGCDLRMSRFDGASLVSASLLKSNLMQARFEGATLTEADLRGANLFEAELLGAKLEGARLDLALLRGTRIGGGA